MRRAPIRTVVVLGAGTMGAQIAAHLAGCGLDVSLLDLVPKDAGGDRSRLARRALENLKRLKPAPLPLHPLLELGGRVEIESVQERSAIERDHLVPARVFGRGLELAQVRPDQRGIELQHAVAEEDLVPGLEIAPQGVHALVERVAGPMGCGLRPQDTEQLVASETPLACGREQHQHGEPARLHRDGATAQGQGRPTEGGEAIAG